MSEPRNHHYVSQVLSKKFLSSEGKIYKYNRNSTYHVFQIKNSTKKLFSEYDLNSRKEHSGEIDHSSVETLLNQNFENDFNIHYDTVVKAINLKIGLEATIPNYDEVINSLDYLLWMALIGQARHPKKIELRNNAIWSTLYKMAELATDELKHQIYALYNNRSDLRNKTPINFKELKDGIKELMGEVTYSINLAPEKDFFMLPDSTAVVVRVKLHNDILNDKIYVNNSEPIASVLMPINSKILISVTSNRIIPKELQVFGHGIYDLESELVKAFNKVILDNSYGEIACENENYLKLFIKDFG
ncbi:hypothetical protein DNU06_15420 [Putridiphycobacter roseus]|uniref:DUF4238 domain-containing protein n=1 Tax=Putridiphycobacter roseus TaxID=2219161 RepID=A0A2W1NCU5_9FLAO|nr:DUF4238 domain-containing protein [Putridiphycobacter roseus]PZE15896.1 hypothetical protein DNU06_15420 [Putridiphycobacter roseus]